MKWQRFVTGLKLCRLLKVLMTLAVMKLALLGLVGWQMAVPGQETVAVRAIVPAQALAQAAPAAQDQGAQDAQAQGSQGQDMQQSSADAVGNAVAQDERQVLDRQSLMRKQEELDRRERELKALEDKITKDLANLEERRAQLARMLDDAQAVRDKKDKHLIDVFSNMKAKQAASVLETMDENQAVKILSGMRGRQAGEILTFVNAEKAARLAEQLTRMQIPFN